MNRIIFPFSRTVFYMNAFTALLLCGTLSLFCVNNTGVNDRQADAIIYEPGGKKAAADVTIRIFDVNDTTGKPVSIKSTDARGCFSITTLPDGLYNIFAGKDSLVLFQDSVAVTSMHSDLRDDTLECSSVLAGTIGLQPHHDPRTATIRIVGAGTPSPGIDATGKFIIKGLAAGTWPLLFTCSLPDYLPALRPVTVAACSHTTVNDTFRLAYTGIPIVSGIRVKEDTLAGTIRVSWEKSSFGNIRDYVIYKDTCACINPSKDFFLSTSQTVFFDSAYRLLSGNLRDTLARCCGYRIAVRDNLRKIGPICRTAEIRFVSQAYITTFFTHGVHHAVLGCDSASINDPVEFSVTAKNRTRPLRSLVWYDPLKNDTIYGISLKDSPETLVTDTLHHTFDSIGVHRLIAMAIDNAGTAWFDTIPVTIVRDAPVALAGNDTGGSVGETILLHGNATQRFGTITGWQWKIGSGDWTTTSGPDTTVTIASHESSLTCSLAVTDDDGNRGVDGMNVSVYTAVRRIVAGYQHSLILDINGALWTCGFNSYGRLGDGSTMDRNTPVLVMLGVKDMAAGSAHTLMLKTDGTLWACGFNYYGQLGNGISENSRPVPVQVMTGVERINAGYNHTLILKTDGTLWACGYNIYGQLGNGTRVNQTVPVQVMTDVQDVAAGGSHTLIIRTDKTLWACGYNNYGELGDGTTSAQYSPVQIMTGVQLIAAGEFHSLMFLADGTLWTCGDNRYGQLGDGTNVNALSPVRILPPHNR